MIIQIFKRLAVFLLILVLAVACKPENNGNGDPLVFTSIHAARDTIFTEDTTRVWVEATGYELKYLWYVEKGDLLGAGAEVTYVATPCTIGINEIFCTVRDGNGKEETKSVEVSVF
ncbi:MAG: hypothetical protein R6V75_06165 [Bacteroidales bacterium]